MKFSLIALILTSNLVLSSYVSGYLKFCQLLGDRQTQLSFIDGILGYRNRAVYAFTIEGTIPPLFCFSIRLHGAHLAQGIRGGSL